MVDFLGTAVLGVVLGLSLAAPPGPVNAIIASHAVTRSWRSGFFVGAGAMTADATFLTISVLATPRSKASAPPSRTSPSSAPS